MATRAFLNRNRVPSTSTASPLAKRAPRLVTVFPRQGHYANDPANLARYPAADVSVERIGDLLELDPAAWLGNTKEIP